MLLSKLFFERNAPAITLSIKELSILDIIKIKGESGICAADVASAISDENKKEPRLSTVYNIVLDLEKKGLIAQSGVADSEGGRPRRIFSITKLGNDSLNIGRSIYSNLAYSV